jgi:iron complex transport system ATP-binding protein
MSEKTIPTSADDIRSTVTGEPSGSNKPAESVPSSNPKLVAENLTLGYQGGESPVIEDESVAVPAGSITALIGPNGSGKSTLLRGLAGQMEPSTGAVYLDGTEVSTFDAKTLARKIGLLSQENVAPDSITVEKLVEHGRYPHRGFMDSVCEEDLQAIERAIELAGIEDIRNREIGSLSGGQRQLVWIAMVLAQETDMLLLDEPTTFLDLHHKLAVMDVLDTLREEADITVVVVLHDIERAVRLADHVVVLKDGSVVENGCPEEIVTEPLLSSVFEIEAIVSRNTNGLQITPVRSVPKREST